MKRQSAVPVESTRRASQKLSTHDMLSRFCLSSTQARSTSFTVESPPHTPRTQQHTEFVLDFTTAQQTDFANSGASNFGFAHSTRDVSDTRREPTSMGPGTAMPMHTAYEMTPPLATVSERSAAIFAELMGRIVDPALRELRFFGAEALTHDNNTTSSPHEEVRLDLSSADASPDEVRLDVPEVSDTEYADLQHHLRLVSHILASNGLDARDVIERIDAKYAKENPAFSWRAVFASYSRDVLPFALGSILVSTLGGMIATPAAFFALRALAESSIMIGINVVWGAAFDAKFGTPKRRTSTPAFGTERLAARTQGLAQLGRSHAKGFALGYGIRNIARLGSELILLGSNAGLWANHRNLIHPALEVPLGFIAAAVVSREIDSHRESACITQLAMLLEEDFAQGLLDTDDHAKRAFFAALKDNLSSDLRSLVPYKVTGILASGLYSLSLLSQVQTSARERYAFASGRWERLEALGLLFACDEAPTQLILAAIYAGIGKVVGESKANDIRRDIESACSRRSTPASNDSRRSPVDSGRPSTISSPSMLCGGFPAPHLQSAGYHAGGGPAFAFSTGAPTHGVTPQCAMTQRAVRRLSPHNGAVPVTTGPIPNDDSDIFTMRM